MDNYKFQLVGADDKPFLGYVSSKDKTSASGQVLVRGSKNVYKKTSGTIASRPGLKRRGSADTTATGIVSSYEWDTSLGAQRVLRVVDITTAGMSGTIYSLAFQRLDTFSTNGGITRIKKIN